MESSNTPDLAPEATLETASPSESPRNDSTPNPLSPTEHVQPPTVKDAILARKGKEVPQASESPAPAATDDATKAPVVPAAAADAAAPVATYQPNYKYKAFGKEKEIPEAFRSMIKDANSEKQVREVFTRADAFDDMKSRHEYTQDAHQKLLNEYSTLDRDVKKVMGFRNSGDYDNFFSNLKISDSDLIQYLQRKAAAMQDPALKAQYDQSVRERADNFSRNEDLTQMRSENQNLAVQYRTMQLDMALNRPDISGAASKWDTQAGEIGAFRNLVTQEAALYWHYHKQDLSAEQAVNLVMQKYGKFLQSPSAPQAPIAPAPSVPQALHSEAAPQATQPQIVPAAKPTMPVLQGNGASPVKRVPKSLDDLKRMGKEAQKAEGLV